MRTEIILLTSSRERKGNTCHTIIPSCSPRSLTPSLRLLRSSQTSFLIAVFMAAFHLGPVCTALANNYSDLAAQGYRWVIVDGPYVCTSEQNVQRIVGHHTEETE